MKLTPTIDHFNTRDFDAHFKVFQYLTSLGIHYLTITEGTDDFLRWEYIDSLPTVNETRFLRHARLERPFLLKNNGRKSQCVLSGT